MISVGQFKKIHQEKYNGKMPVHRFLFEFPTARITDLKDLLKFLNLKVEDGFIVSREAS